MFLFTFFVGYVALVITGIFTLPGVLGDQLAKAKLSSTHSWVTVY